MLYHAPLYLRSTSMSMKFDELANLRRSALDFMRRCSFQSVDPTVKRLIDKAIAQRIKS
jgi:hypothetical protein